MDTKEIVEKALKGEDYSILIKDMSDEEQTKVKLAIRDAATTAAKEGLEKVTGLRQAEKALKDKKDAETTGVLESFKKEQLEKAKRKFFSDPDFTLTDVQKTQFEAEITARGIQSTDAEFVFDELKKIYGSLNVDNLISEKKKAIEGKKGADGFISRSAGAGSPGSN